MKPHTRFVLSLLVLVACLPPMLTTWRQRNDTGERTFVMPVAKRPPPTTPDFRTELLPVDPNVASVHVASICEAPGGTICAAWYGGSHEGARDVNIYWSRMGPGTAGVWSKPQVLVSRTSAMEELRRPIKKVGNAVLFADNAGHLHLIYVSISLGGWSTSSLNAKTSHDGGETWQRSQRLTLSPFLNLSELVKNNPLPMSDGVLAVPIYHEFLAKFPEILWLNENAQGQLTWSKSRIFGGRSALQPALLPQNSTAAIALCRDCSPAKHIQMARSSDVGRSWSRLEQLALPNSDSGLDAIRLADGRMLLAFNDSETGRESLGLAVSEDGGATWIRRARLESESDSEFSYPYLLQTSGGRIHLVYTWKRKAIKYASFNPSWLDEQTGIGGGTTP